MKRTRITSCSLLLLLLTSARLAGQTYRTFADEREGIRSAAGFRLGPLKIAPALRVHDVGRDSNVYFGSEEEAVVADFTGMLAGEFNGYWLVGDSLILTVTDTPEYLFYLREQGLRAFTNSFSSGLRFLALRRFSLSAGYHVRRHTRRPTSEITQLLEDTVEGWEGSLFFETARGTSLGVRGTSDEFRYRDLASEAPDDTYGRTLDRRESSILFEFYYRVLSRSFLFVSAGPTRDEFRYPGSSWRNARSFQAMGGIRLPLLGRARGQVSLGWKGFTPESPEREAFSGLVSATDVSLRFWRLGVNLDYARDNYYSSYETAYYYVEDRFRGGLSFYLTPFLRLDAEVRHGVLNYPEAQVIWQDGAPVTVHDRRDVQWTRSLGLVVRVAENTGLGLSYNLYNRTSNAPGFDIDRGFLGASLTYDF
ncbi:MAG: hypothetical protein FJY79_02710 [Candidatus Aminicenantes bacterium]|nr:hypothetical protein [Candidatus Aminicenantes bacterium]